MSPASAAAARRRVRRTVAVALLLAASASAPLRAQSTYEQLQTFSGVLSHVRNNYVDSVEFSGLVRASIEGMLRSLDPHSYYVSRRDFELRTAWDRGQLAGVGLALEDVEGRIAVLGVTPEGPAARAGVMPGDRVLRLNDSTAAGLGARALEVRLLGEKGTKVRLGLERGIGLGADTFTVTLKRALIEHRVVSTPQMADSATGYVRLEQFTPPAPKELTDAVDRLRDMGARQVILDLRGNPGGDMSALVEIASQFLPEGVEIFHTQGRKRTGLDSAATREKGRFVKLPLILLVDDGTASAAEILAGALQDHDRALVVGRRSFGKALMQNALPLPNGDVIWLTSARIVTPSGRVIQRPYRGLVAEQYVALAGTSGPAGDTASVFLTRQGRRVRGGGGIEPDVTRRAAELPVWYSVAADSGLVSVVADSVGATLAPDAAARRAWAGDPARWQPLLVEPLLARVRQRLGVAAEPDSAVRARLGRILAARAAEVRWGTDAAAALVLQHDPDVRLALEQFPRLAALLARPAAVPAALPEP